MNKSADKINDRSTVKAHDEPELRYRPIYSSGASYLPATYGLSENYPGKYDHLGSDASSYSRYIPSSYIPHSSRYLSYLESKYDYINYPRLYSDYDYYYPSSYYSRSAYL
jgi:hypothetical protein